MVNIKPKVEEAYKWIMDQKSYPTLTEFYDHFGFEMGQILFWYLIVKLGWIFKDDKEELMSMRVDNPKLQKLLDTAVRI